MHQLNRLLRYIRPYWFQLLVSVVCLALVGLLDAFRVLLVGPIFDRVLNPHSQSRELPLFRVPCTTRCHPVELVRSRALSQFVDDGGLCPGDRDRPEGNLRLRRHLPGELRRLRHDHRPARTICTPPPCAARWRSSTSTRPERCCRPSSTTSKRCSTRFRRFWPNSFSNSSPCCSPLVVVIVLGGRLAWVLAIFVPFILMAARRIGSRVRSTTRRGQDKLAEIQNILHETITGVRIVKAFCMEAWETAPLPRSRQAPVPRQPAFGERRRHQLPVDGHYSEPSPSPCCC